MIHSISTWIDIEPPALLKFITEDEANTPVPDEYSHRTAITRLELSLSERRAIEETIDAYREGCQIATDLAWNECYQPGDVQSLAYDEVRDRTGLKSQHAILATHQAAEAITGCVDRFEAGLQASKPEFTAPSITYDARTMTLFDDGTVSLTTLGSRVRCDLALPSDEDGYQYQYLDDGRWSVAESTLTVRDGECYLHIGFRRPQPDPSIAEGGTVLGVDLGVENLAVTSTACFFSGGELNHRRREFKRRRQRLLERGTESAKETLDSIEGRERRYVRDELHCVSKAIVEEAETQDCHVIALEDLDRIQEVLPRMDWFRSWAYGRLATFIEYKAATRGIEVVTVDSRNTSKRCPECGHVDSTNRPTLAQFRCTKCNRQQHADYNAAVNIGLRYVRRGPQSSRRTGASRCALKSGTVTPSGEFIAHPDGSEVESADKSR